MSEDQNFSRRNVLQGLGAGSTATLFSGLVSATEEDSPQQELDVSTIRLDGEQAARITENLLGMDETQALLREVQGRGYTAKVGEAVVKRLETGHSEESHEGIIIPLQNEVSDVNSQWGEADNLVTETLGYLTVDNSEETAPAAFYMGVSSSGTTATDTLRAQSEQTLSWPSLNNQRGVEIKAMEIVTPENSYQGSISRPSSTADSSDDAAFHPTNEHTVKECVSDNVGVIGGGGIAVSCGLCFTIDPADITVVKAVLECGSCLAGSIGVACLTGYCQKEDGGSVGNTFCEAADTVASTPSWLLGGFASVYATFKAIDFGCKSDESTDCQSPLVD